MLGCGANLKNDTKKSQTPPIPPETTANTGPVAVTQRSPQGQIIWTLKSEKSQITYGGEGKLSGTLENVSGELYQGGKLASKFKCNFASADQEQNRLEMHDSVRIVDIAEDATLMADHVVWEGDAGHIRASGNVRVMAKSYEMGPFEELWASPDLMQVGTPDVFTTKNVDQGRNANATYR